MSAGFAVCLSASQGVDRPTAVAYLSHWDTEGRDVKVRVEWELPHSINADSPSDWLYAVLSRLVQDFDDHTVTEASVGGSDAMKEDLSA